MYVCKCCYVACSLKVIAKLERVMFSRGPTSQRAQKEKRVDYERKERELKKLRFELQKVSECGMGVKQCSLLASFK